MYDDHQHHMKIYILDVLRNHDVYDHVYPSKLLHDDDHVQDRENVDKNGHDDDGDDLFLK